MQAKQQYTLHLKNAQPKSWELCFTWGIAKDNSLGMCLSAPRNCSKEERNQNIQEKLLKKHTNEQTKKKKEKQKQM